MNEQLENNNKQVVINRLINKKLNNLLMLPIHYKKLPSCKSKRKHFKV